MAVLGSSPARAQQAGLYCWADAKAFCATNEQEIGVPCACPTASGAPARGLTITSWRLKGLLASAPTPGRPPEFQSNFHKFARPNTFSGAAELDSGRVRSGSGGHVGPAAAPSPGDASAPNVLDTAYAPLFEPGKETPGYGLYSYLIMTANDARATAMLTAILQETHTPDAARLEWPKHEQLNLLLVPMQQASRNLCNAVTAGSLQGCGEGGLAEAVKAYDYDRAQTFLYRMCPTKSSALPRLCSQGAHIGPYLFTYRRPASAMPEFEPPFLLVDLSHVDPAAFAEYFAAYKAQVQTDPTRDDGVNSLRLKVLNLVMAGVGLLIPVKTAVADMLQFAPAK
jgi:hypothetical protein